jgi:predicted PurR-regulated permease PerM
MSFKHSEKSRAASGDPGRDRSRWGLANVSEVATIGLFATAIVFALDWASYFLIPFTAAMIVGMTFGPVVDRLVRAGLPMYLAGMAIVTSVAAGIYVLFLAFAIPLEEWSQRIPQIMARLRQLVFWIKDPLERIYELSREVREAANAEGTGMEVSVRNTGVVTTFLASAPAFFGQLLIFIGAFYFFIVSRSRVRAGLLMLAPSRRARLRVARILRDTEHSLSHYLLAISMVYAGVGVATGLAMWLLGMPSPALWGALAAVFSFLPFVGPALTIVILAGVALITFDTAPAILAPPLAFFAINLLESQFVTPIVLGMRLTLNPLIVFLSLAFWLWLWGPVGAFLAVPIVVLSVITLYHCLPPGQREVFSLGIRRKPDKPGAQLRRPRSGAPPRAA